MSHLGAAVPGRFVPGGDFRPREESCCVREGCRAPGGGLSCLGGFSSLPGRVSGFLKERCRIKEDCRRIVRSTLLDAETLLQEPGNPPARATSPPKSHTQGAYIAYFAQNPHLAVGSGTADDRPAGVVPHHCLRRHRNSSRKDHPAVLIQDLTATRPSPLSSQSQQRGPRCSRQATATAAGRAALLLPLQPRPARHQNPPDGITGEATDSPEYRRNVP